MYFLISYTRKVLRSSAHKFHKCNSFLFSISFSCNKILIPKRGVALYFIDGDDSSFNISP